MGPGSDDGRRTSRRRDPDRGADIAEMGGFFKQKNRRLPVGFQHLIERDIRTMCKRQNAGRRRMWGKFRECVR